MKRKHLSELAQFFTQLSACGVDAAPAVAAAMAVDEAPARGGPVRELAALLTIGTALPDAMAEMPADFPAPTVALVRHAMTEDRGGAAFALLAADYRALDRQQREAWSGLTYPALLLVGVVLLLLETSIFAMPAYTEYIASLGGKLPALTVFVMGALPALTGFLVLLAACWALMRALRVAPLGAVRRGVARIAVRLTGMHRYHQHGAEPRLVLAAAVAVRAGLPLQLVAAHLCAMSDGLQAALFSDLQRQLAAGLQFGAACQAVPGFSRRLGALATVAQGSGRLAESLSLMGDLLAEQGQEQRARWRRRVAIGGYVIAASITALCIVSLYLPIFMLGGN